jgi:TPR repeat protein
MGACVDGDRCDPEAAARWLRLAAEQGLPNAQRAYGRRFEEGEGAPSDLGEAVRWMRLAAARGFVRAIDDLRRLLEGCGACGVAPAAAAGGRLFTCMGCRCVAYCSGECQKRDWRDRHKQECRALRDAKEAAGEAAAGDDGVPD